MTAFFSQLVNQRVHLAALLVLGGLFGGLSATAQSGYPSALVLRLETRMALDDTVTIASNRAQHWRNRLRAFGFQASIGEADSLNGSLFDYDVVVLPGASRALNAAETELLLSYVDSGGSLILTGRAGTRQMDNVRGDSLADHLGLRYHDDVFGETDSWLVVMDQPSILSARIDRMQNLAVQAEELVFVDSVANSAAFWLDQRQSPPDYRSAAERTAITYGLFGRGSFFWMGFPIDGVGGDLDSSEAFYRLLGNVLEFFDGMPIADLAPWPAPYKTAATFSMDVEQQFGNIRRVFDMENLPPFTHFILTNQGELYAEILAEVANFPDAEQEIALHGNNHDVFRGQDPQLQYDRFNEAKHSITRIAGTPPSGFRPPEEAYDFFTVRSLLENGYNYMLANAAPRAAVPKISREWGKPSILRGAGDVLVQFNIHNKDDVKIILGNDRPTPEEAFRYYVEDFEQIHLREGLYIANIHSHILATEKYINVFERVIDHVGSFNPWIANCRQIADWWRKRDRVLLTHFRRDPHNIIFGIENNSGAPIEGLTVDVWMPYAASTASIDSRPELDDELEYRIEGNRLRLFLDDLETDAVREYHVSWRGLD